MNNFKGGICFQDTLPLLGLACLLGTIEHMSVKGGETQTEMSGAETSDRDRPTGEKDTSLPPSASVPSLSASASDMLLTAASLLLALVH